METGNGNVTEPRNSLKNNVTFIMSWDYRDMSCHIDT